MAKRIILVLILFSFISTGFVLAKTERIISPIEYETLAELIEAIIDFIFYLSIPLTILMILVSGFLFISSSGEPEKIKEAKNTIMYTLIGFLIICSSKGIITVIKNVLEVKQSSP